MNLRMMTRRLDPRDRPQLERLVRRRLAFALDRFRAQIRSVWILLEDTNGGRRGGVDKRVVLQVEAGGRSLRVEKEDAELERALDRAVEVAAHNLPRQLRRSRRRVPG